MVDNSIHKGDSLRNEFSTHPFFEAKINAEEFSSTWHYWQNQMMTQLLQAFTLVSDLKSRTFKQKLEGRASDEVVNRTKELFSVFTDIIREETGGESIDGEQPSKMSHADLLEHMLKSMGLNIEELQQKYNPTQYPAINAWLDSIYDNQYKLIHHIAWMEVFENIAKPLFDKMSEIYQNYEGDKRFISFHQAIEGSHGEKNDDMTNMFLNIFPEQSDELSKLIETYKVLWSNVLTEFSNMKAS